MGNCGDNTESSTADLDATMHFLNSSAIDLVRGLCGRAYPANGGAFGGRPKRLLIRSWQGRRTV